LFRSRLDQIIDMKHPLAILAGKIDWEWLHEKCRNHYAGIGRPGNSIRRMLGLLILKHMENLSDETLCERWIENPYYQFFCGEEFFQHRFPIERSSLSHFRSRIDEATLESLLSESLRVANDTGAIRLKDTEKVAIDTTVQEKNIAFPTDSRLRYKAIVGLGKVAKLDGIDLRQSYIRVAKQQLIKSQRYRHAKQFGRAKRAEKKLKTYLGRIIRDIYRKTGDNAVSERMKAALAKANKIHRQERTDKIKLFSWHAPEVECIPLRSFGASADAVGKGKPHKPWEFGCKVSIATNVNPAPGGNFIFHAKALHGKPYDGHTLKTAIENITKIIGREPSRNYVDKGYTGHDYDNPNRVFKSGQKRGVFGKIKKELRRRTVVEPVIGHAKHDHRMNRNYLHGHHGDRLNPILASIGFNFHQLKRWLRDILFFLWNDLLQLLRASFPEKIMQRTF